MNVIKIDRFLFAFPTNMNEVFKRVGNLKNNQAVRIDSVSAEVLKTSLPVFFFILFDFLNLSSSRGWLPKFLKNAKGYPLDKATDITNIRNYRSFRFYQLLIQ